MHPIDHRPQVAAQRRERMRARLLSAALTLAAEQGLAGVTIDAVISKAEVARGTFYKYFDTPNALIQEVGTVVSDALIRGMHPSMEALGDPAERIATGIRLVVRLADRHPQIGNFIVRSGWPVVDFSHAFFELVGEDIALAMSAGRFASMPQMLALNIVAGITIGAMDATGTPGLPADFPEQAAAAALRALGLSAEESRSLASQPVRVPELDLELLRGMENGGDQQ